MRLAVCSLGDIRVAFVFYVPLTSWLLSNCFKSLGMLAYGVGTF